MGDGFQIIVDREVSKDEAPHLAEKVREWLVARRVIKPELTDGQWNSPGYRPGPGYTVAVETPDPDLFSMLANELVIIVGRTFFWTPYTNLTCRACGARFDAYSDEWVEAVGAWHQGDDSAAFACPECGNPERVTEWSGESTSGFGNLGFKFWNWPPLAAGFVREVTELLGHRTVLVRGKL